ncbi:MAG: HAD family phosphatase, partial [Candidatus Merdisoma sp.]
MIDTVIFDLGNVLVGFGWEEWLRSIVPEEKDYLAVEQAVFRNPAWVEHDKGLLTEEEELEEFLSAAPEYEAEIRQVYKDIGRCIWDLP